MFDALTSLNTTTKECLLIDLSMLLQSYENRDISKISWIPGMESSADALTKFKYCNALQQLVNANRIDLSPEMWIECSLQKTVCGSQFEEASRKDWASQNL